VSAAKIFAVVSGVILLFVILLAGTGYYWWQTQGPKLKAEGGAAKIEAAEFGSSTDNLGCLEESFQRLDRCENRFNCNVINNVFLLHCLKASSTSIDFCEGVPETGSITESTAWRLNQCGQRGRSGPHCATLVGQVQAYCDWLLENPDAYQRTVDAPEQVGLRGS
jgi:hypothetical protein